MATRIRVGRLQRARPSESPVGVARPRSFGRPIARAVDARGRAAFARAAPSPRRGSRCAKVLQRGASRSRGGTRRASVPARSSTSSGAVVASCCQKPVFNISRCAAVVERVEIAKRRSRRRAAPTARRRRRAWMIAVASSSSASIWSSAASGSRSAHTKSTLRIAFSRAARIEDLPGARERFGGGILRHAIRAISRRANPRLRAERPRPRGSREARRRRSAQAIRRRRPRVGVVELIERVERGRRGGHEPRVVERRDRRGRHLQPLGSRDRAAGVELGMAREQRVERKRAGALIAKSRGLRLRALRARGRWPAPRRRRKLRARRCRAGVRRVPR